jgi:hypothetical protein
MASGPCFSSVRPSVASGEEWAGTTCAVWCGSTAWCGPTALFVLPNRRRPRQYLATQRGESGPIHHQHRPYGLSACSGDTTAQWGMTSGCRGTTAATAIRPFLPETTSAAAALKKCRDNRSVSIAAGAMWRISTSSSEACRRLNGAGVHSIGKLSKSTMVLPDG